MKHQMDGFSFEPSVTPEADTIPTAQTLQYVISALSDDADSIISGSLGGHVPPLSAPLLSFSTVPATKSCKGTAEASPATGRSGRTTLHRRLPVHDNTILFRDFFPGRHMSLMQPQAQSSAQIPKVSHPVHTKNESPPPSSVTRRHATAAER